MKITSYVLLGLLSCVEVLAEETTAFDKAVEAYRTHQKTRRAYFEAIDAHEETRLAWAAYRAIDLADSEALKKARATFERTRDENKEVKGAYAIYQITDLGYDKALHKIEEVQLAFVAWKEARSALDEANGVIDEAIRTGQPAGARASRAAKEAQKTFEEAVDIYTTVLGVFHEAVKEAYKKSEKSH